LYPTASHTHTLSIASGTTATSGSNSSPANWDTATSNPPYLEVIFIKSLGTAFGIPNNGLMYYNGAAPSGWTIHAASANRFWRGAAAAGNGGGTGGTSDSHTHTSASHTHPSGGTHTHSITVNSTSGDQNAFGTPNESMSVQHGHSATTSGTAAPAFSGGATPSSASGDARPAWKKVVPIKNTSGTSLDTSLVIGIWLGTLASIPATWRICDGNNGTPNVFDLYVNGAANAGENGNTGGSGTHTHAAGGSHTHTIDAHIHGSVTTAGSSGGTVSTNSAPGNGSRHDHTHTTGALSNNGSGTSGSQTVTGSANSANDPVFTRVAYIQKK